MKMMNLSCALLSIALLVGSAQTLQAEAKRTKEKTLKVTNNTRKLISFQAHLENPAYGTGWHQVRPGETGEVKTLGEWHNVTIKQFSAIKKTGINSQTIKEVVYTGIKHGKGDDWHLDVNNDGVSARDNNMRNHLIDPMDRFVRW